MIKNHLFRSRLSRRITFLNLIILILVLAVIAVLSMEAVTGITDTASRRIAHIHSQESVGRFMSHLNSNLVLLRKVAHSRAVQEWFADEHNDQKRYAALNELLNMVPFLQVPEFYMGLADSLNEYVMGLNTSFDDFVSHGSMSPYEPMDEWFFNMMETDRAFTFNVDIDKATHTWNIWLLYRVVHEGRDVGLLCIPFRIEDVLDDVFGQYYDEFVRGYIVDGNGFVHIESGAFYHYTFWEAESIHISAIDAGLGEFVYNFTMRDETFFAEDAQIAVVRLTGGHHDYAAIAPIPHSSWMIITLFDSRMLFSVADILPVLIILISAFIVFAFVSMATIHRGVLMPLANLTGSVSLVTNDNAKASMVYGEDRTDEIGDLSRTIHSMLKRVGEAAVKEQELLERVFEEQKRIEVAEESNQAKSAFLARMSHEIRTPISAVLGISEIGLQTPGIPQNVENSFSKIYSSGKLLLGIINDILDFSRIEGGKMIIAPIKYDTASLINNAANLHYAYVGEKNIKFNLHVDENLPINLIGDTLRIEQIILNVLSNAFKYTDSGSVNLSLRCRPLDPEKITLIISISDTGLGMTEEQVAVLFDDYTRFHEQEKSSVSGTGLGMPIVANLVQMMGGTIEVESKKGTGTTATINIPQEVASTVVLGRETAARLQLLEAYLDRTDKKRSFVPDHMPYGKVLVVDDIQANLYVAQGLLAFYSLKVETCCGGQEAIDKIKQGNVYDIVFMDHMMPGINGPQAMSILRDMGYTYPIVVLTANALIGQEEEYIKSGFDSFLSKPIMTEKLNSVLIKYIKDKQPPEVVEAAERDALARREADGMPQNIDEFRDDVYVFGKLRTDFYKSHKNTFYDINQALNAGDTETAHILAHTLKGLAGMINESSLAQAASRLERVLAEGKTPANEQLDALEKELLLVFESIGKPEATVFPGYKTFDKNRAIALFDELYPLLKAQNSDSMNLLDELRLMPEMAILVHHIENFEFEQALKTLGTLRKILEVE